MIASRRVLGVVGAILLVAVFIACGDPTPNSSGGVSITKTDAEFDGLIFARRHIDPFLKSPSTADYDCTGAKAMEPIVDSAGVKRACWIVVGTLDAKNAFGVPIRHQWIVALTRCMDARESECAAVSLDDTMVFELAGFDKMLKDNKQNTAKADEDAQAKAKAAADETARLVAAKKSADDKAMRDRLEREAAAKAKAKRDAKREADEPVAENLFEAARKEFVRGAVDAAADQLRVVVRDYPDTKAGEKAKKLLKEIGK